MASIKRYHMVTVASRVIKRMVTPISKHFARPLAEGLLKIDFEAHRGSKAKVRAACLADLRAAIEAELGAPA